MLYPYDNFTESEPKSNEPTEKPHVRIEVDVCFYCEILLLVSVASCCCSRFLLLPASVSKKTCATTLKNVFLAFEKCKKCKKKLMYSFTDHLITQPLIHNYKRSEPVIRYSPTSNVMLRNVETRKCNLLLCVINAYKSPHNIREFFKPKFLIDIQQTLYLSEVCELILPD